METYRKKLIGNQTNLEEVSSPLQTIVVSNLLNGEMKVTVLVRQQNRFYAIMDNFNRVQGVTNELMTANGTLMDNYSVYLDSVEASANRMKASFETMWINAIDSNVIKGYYDFLTVLIQILDKLNPVRVAMIALNAIIITKIRNSKLYTAVLAQEKIMTDAKTVSEIKQTTATKMSMTSIIAKTKALLGSITATGASTVATNALGIAKLKLSAIITVLKAKVFTLQAMLTLGLSVALYGVIALVTKAIGSFASAGESLSSFTDEARNAEQQHNSNIMSIRGMQEEFDELNNKLGENRDFTRLTSDEQQRYNQMVEQIRQIAPEVVSNVDEMGNSYVRYGTTLEDIIQKERELADIQRQKLLSKEREIAGENKSDIQKERAEIEEIERNIKSIEEFMKSGSNDTFIIDGETLKGVDELRNKLRGLNAERNIAQDAIRGYQQEQSKLLDIYFEEIESIDGLSQSIKDQARENVWNTLFTDGYDEAKQNIVDWGIVIEEMSDVMQGGMGIPETSQMTDELSDAFDRLGLNAEQKTELFYNLARALGHLNMGISETGELVGLDIDKMNELEGYTARLMDVYEKLATGQNLSIEETNELISEYEVLAQYIAETGDITFKQGELIMEMMERSHEKTIGYLHESIRENKKVVKELELQLQLEAQRLEQLEQTGDTSSALYRNISEEVERLAQKLGDARIQQKMYNNELEASQRASSQFNAQQVTEVNTRAYDEATKKLKEYHAILQEINNTGGLSHETSQKIVQHHQELIHLLGEEGAMRDYIMEQIAILEDRQLSSYRNMLKASEGFYNSLLRQNTNLYNAIARAYDIDLANFRSAGALKVQMANATAREIAKAYTMTFSSSTTSSSSTNSVAQGPFFDKETQALVTQKRKLEAQLKSTPTGINPIRSFLERDLARVNRTLEQKRLANQHQSTTDSTATSKVESSQSAVAGVGNPNAIPSGGVSGGGGSGGGSGGVGSGGSSAPKAPEYEKRDLVDLEIDRYKLFEQALNEVNRALERHNYLLDMSTGRDRIALLDKQNKILADRQKILEKYNSERRDEMSELRSSTSNVINYNDGTQGIKSFQKYAKGIESQINTQIKALNATNNEDARKPIEKRIKELEKTHDKVKEEFNRYHELYNEIPEASNEWWELQYQIHENNLQMLVTRLEDYDKGVKKHLDFLSLYDKIKLPDSIDTLEKELGILEEMGEQALENRSALNNQLFDINNEIAREEANLKKMGNVRNGEYDRINRRLILLRRYQDELMEGMDTWTEMVFDTLRKATDKRIEMLNYERDQMFEMLDAMREIDERFNSLGLEHEIRIKLADLDLLDEIFIEDTELNLKTDTARKGFAEVEKDIKRLIEELDEMDALQKSLDEYEWSIESEEESLKIANQKKDVAKIQIALEQELLEKREELAKLTEDDAFNNLLNERALENQIKLKEDELAMLREKRERENRITRELEKQLELLRAMDDRRFSYITGRGEEVFTYDVSRVNSLRNELDKMRLDRERNDDESKLTEEIEKMREELDRTRQINQAELDVMRLMNAQLDQILNQLDSDIDDSKESIGEHFENITNGILEQFEKAMMPLIETNQRLNDLVTVIRGQTVVTGEGVNTPLLNTSGIKGFDTGGYTGSFSSGKLAVLHEKELVLNKDDTKNILGVVNSVRAMATKPFKPSGISSVSNNSSENNSIVIENLNLPSVKDGKSFVQELNNFFRKGMIRAT